LTITSQDVLDVPPKLLIDQPRYLGICKRRDRVLQLFEFADIFLGQQISPDAEDLAEFDEGGPKLFKNYP
jgi:hypothetical protein